MSQTLVDTVLYKGYQIEIHQDLNPQNPRTEWDNVCTMVCAHRKYHLGDTKLDIKLEDFGMGSWEELEKYLTKTYNPIIIKPLYMLDHSGLTISTSPFGDRWDSGQIGFIFIPRATAFKEYGGKRVTPKLKKLLNEVLQIEVAIYDDYLSGDVYGYSTSHSLHGELDSCWGFYGHDHTKSGLLESAQGFIDGHLLTTAKEAQEREAKLAGTLEAQVWDAVSLLEGRLDNGGETTECITAFKGDIEAIFKKNPTGIPTLDLQTPASDDTTKKEMGVH